MRIESGKSVFTLDFNGEVNEDERVFLEVAKEMIDRRLGTGLTKASVTEIEPVHTKVIKGKAPELTVMPSELTVGLPNDTTVKQPRQKFSSVREFLEAQERRLIVGACDCEKVYHFWVDDLNQKEFKFTCHRCEEEKVINIDELVPATYKCEDCGKQSSFWTEPAQSVAVDCIGCKAEVDLFYHDKKKIMTNRME